MEKNKHYLDFLAKSADGYYMNIAEMERKHKDCVLRYIYELQGGDGKFIQFENDYPAYSEHNLEFDSAIFGVRVIRYEDDSLKLFIYTDESGSELDLETNEDGWFDPFSYGNLDLAFLMSVLEEDYRK